jgi:hypothetical protein
MTRIERVLGTWWIFSIVATILRLDTERGAARAVNLTEEFGLRRGDGGDSGDAERPGRVGSR